MIELMWRRMLKTARLSTLLLLVIANGYQPQVNANPIDLGIPNLPQETDVWCWAAVTRQILVTLQGHTAPQQCELVAAASGAHPGYCCGNFNNCRRTGGLHEIQQLIAHYGGRYSNLALPTDPMTLYNTIAMRRAVIMAVQMSPYGPGHVVVIRGMRIVPTPMGPMALLLINDPMAWFSQEVPYQQLLPYWRSAIVVH
jgi:hypothetical protein